MTARAAYTALVLCGLVGVPGHSVIAQAGGSVNARADWPCVQVLQPELSVGAMWTGPDPAQVTSYDAPGAAELVRRVAPRRVAVEEANAEIRRFLAGTASDRSLLATRVFVALFDSLGVERSAIIRGIHRYSARQAALLERIESARRALDALDPRSGDAAVRERRAELEVQIGWDSRILEDREKLLPAICELPTLIERRLFALSRTLAEEAER
jgi:hypothetical protein